MDGLDLDFVRNGLITFILLVLSLAIHEWAHAFAADKLGDDTPRLQGRVTLNPLAHIDLLGTIIVPLFSIFFLRSFALIGWGRPVLTNPSNFSHHKRDDILTTLAGPAANLLIALLSVVVGSFVVLQQPRLAEILSRLIMMNVGLAIFNLLPIPPLDGGYVMRHVVGMTEETFLTISRWSGWIMLFALNLTIVRNIFGVLFVFALTPYLSLCRWLNPGAMQLLFFPLFR